MEDEETDVVLTTLVGSDMAVPLHGFTVERQLSKNPRELTTQPDLLNLKDHLRLIVSNTPLF